MSVHFSSKRMDWETPQKLFNELNEKYNFTIDVATNGKNSKLENFYTEKDNALNKKWKGRVFCNPPYGREIKKWVKKAYEESKKNYNEIIVLLIPARTDTSYWHDYIFNKANEINFIKGRLKFELDGKQFGAAPFPSAIIIFNKEKGTYKNGK